MHNALRWFLLWTLFPFVIVAADPPPPLVRSVLSTNLPPFGLTGQALFRTANLPYLDWSNIVQQVIDTNAFQPASANLTNWSLISTNALTGKLDSNVWWAAWGSLSTNALTGKLDSNYWFTVWGAIATNALTAKLDSNWWWTAYGSNLSNLTNGNGNGLTNVVLSQKNVYDNFGRITVSGANLGTMTSGWQWDLQGSSFGQVPPPTSFASNGWWLIEPGSDWNYAAYDFQSPLSQAGGRVSWTTNSSSGGGYSAFSVAIGPQRFQSLTNLTNMIHAYTSRQLWAVEVWTNYITDKITIASGTYPSVLPADGSTNIFEIDVNGPWLTVVLPNGTTNKVFDPNLMLSGGRHGFFEMTSGSGATNVITDRIRVHDVWASSDGWQHSYPQKTNAVFYGNTGFNTNNPGASVDIQGSAPVSGYMLRTGSGASTNLMTLDSSGNLSLNRYANASSAARHLNIYNQVASEDGISLGSGLFEVGKMTANGNTGEFSVGGMGGAYFDTIYAGGSERVRITSAGQTGIGTNSPQSRLHVTADNSAANATIIQTTNRFIQRWDTNGNSYLTGAITPTNGIINLVSNAFIANLVIVTNNPQIYCLNGTNQLITLPDCTKIPTGQIIRFASTNGFASMVLTNATGAQTIRDGTSLDYKASGVFSVAFFSDGAAWWIASKAKTIWANSSWSTSTNVPMAVAGSNYISFDTLETHNAQGITLTNGYQIYVADPGQYLLTISVVTQVGHNNDTNRLWLQQSGQNVARTRTDVKLPTTTAQTVMTVNFIVPVVTNLTWFGLCVRSTDTGAQLVTGAAGDATMPAMPSAIVTVNKISDTFP